MKTGFPEAYSGQIANAAEDAARAARYAKIPRTAATRSEKVAFKYGFGDGANARQRASLFSGEREAVRDAYRRGFAKGTAWAAKESAPEETQN